MAVPFLAAIPIIGDLLKGVFDIIDKSVEDKDAAAKMKNELTMKTLDTQFQLQNGQIETNKVEAANQSIFVAGWRPAIGWICALSLGWHFIGHDISAWVLALTKSTMVAPKLMGGDNLMELVLAMLGLAGFRTYEKSKVK
jgi:hypothetical protein